MAKRSRKPLTEQQRLRHLECGKRWRLAHPDRVMEINAKKRANPWHKKSPENRARNLANARRGAIRRMGWKPEDISEKLISQQGCCAICGVLMIKGKGKDECMALDHCHTTGKARGILCMACNRGLGQFKDSEWALRNAANYIGIFQ